MRPGTRGECSEGPATDGRAFDRLVGVAEVRSGARGAAPRGFPEVRGAQPGRFWPSLALVAREKLPLAGFCALAVGRLPLAGICALAATAKGSFCC